MKPIDILDIPHRIGDAEIVLFPEDKRESWERNESRLSERKEKSLILRGDPETARFYELMKGEQFIFTASSGNRRHVFFGGMDESPFLAELELEVLEAMIGGEEAFFEALKPRQVRQWERSVGVRAKRQGDFFAVPPTKKGKQTWEELFMKALKMDGPHAAKITNVTGAHLRGTRHLFAGLLADINGCIVGDGVITAPDHEELELRGPHLIEQAQYLVRPQQAD